MLGHRFVQIHHLGRRSGRPFTAVVEVVRYDPATGARPVGQAEAEQVLRGYLRRYRLGAPPVNAFLGWLAGRPFDASPADITRLCQEMPMLAVRPEAA